jgi:prepilin-type N-terminal cleavage/methylation domain-containing protein
MRQCSNKAKAQRGFTLAEMLTVLVLLGLFMSVITGVLNPLTHVTTQAQSKAETVQTAAQAFYRIQRDVRKSSAAAIYLCNLAGTTCGQSQAPVLAVATADDANGVNQLAASGTPGWKGFYVYWVSGNTLYRSYQPVSPLSGNPTPNATDANTAVAAANPSSPSASNVLVTGVSSLTVGFNGSSKVIGLTLAASNSYGGAPNATSYESDTVPRNSY